ncbi:hypothetical protein [Companilactobacillus zhongbaensis]|uniref:hypothetical protein n=1 Tax=Companilactobacillus zhongbaensis TaxID=2486009 RepID=UPI000F79E3C2|nr:hypothetical protein [Companilactobacillus zhongbaensis]
MKTKGIFLSACVLGSLIAPSFNVGNVQAATVLDQEVNYDDLYVRNDVIIHTNLGPQIVRDQEGPVRQILTIKVPEKRGYTADKKTVKALVTQSGIICAEFVTYTKDVGAALVVPDLSSESFKGFVATKDKYAELYAFDPKTDQPTIGNRMLGQFTDWKSDGLKEYANESYYRVSTNEWVKASQVYRYENKTGVLTGRRAISPIVNNNTNQIANLPGGTDWAYDRIAFLNDQDGAYYRISGNQFVNEYFVTEK